MYRPFRPQPPKINYKINEQITALELRVVDENGENVGVLPLDAALKLAKEKGLDLIEIAPTVKPPVAKIMSFDKFRYQKEKELKKQKAAQKTGELKQVQITVKSAKNDLEVRIKKIDEFFKEGHKVEIVLKLFGREKANKDWARFKLEEFLKMLPFEY
ncbi:translation initiation factor IF-3, partial [Candidatus Wolfebacteria bacterium]|nr:translation initiation factor IF-3 [Candidatus Wolfebacteria bacterium]